MDLIVFIAAIAGLLWATVYLCRTGLLGGCAAMLLVAACFSQPFYFASSPALTIDRVLLLIVVGQFIFYRLWGWTEPKPLLKSDYILLIFIGLMVVSTFTHDWRVEKNMPLLNLTFYWVIPFIIYWIVRESRLGDREILWIFGGFTLFGIYLALTAMAEAGQAPSLVFPRYISSPLHKEFLGRARGPVLNPAGNGVLMTACLAALAMWWPRVGKIGKMLIGLVLVPLMLAGLYCTLTRSAWMGAGLCLVVIIGATLPRRWRTPALIGALFLGTAGLATNWDSLLTYKRDKGLDAELSAESAALRPVLAIVAWHMFQDHPLFGVGQGQYPPESRPYLADHSSELPLEKVGDFIQHNVWLALLVDTGIVGAGLFTIVNILWLSSAWSLWRDPTRSLAQRQCGLWFLAAFAGYFPNAMFHDVSVMLAINLFLFFMVGVTTNLVAARAATTASGRGMHARWSNNAAALKFLQTPS